MSHISLNILQSFQALTFSFLWIVISGKGDMKSVSRSINLEFTINPHIFQYVFDQITPISLIYELSSPLEFAVICVGKITEWWLKFSYCLL